jgi:hypothetical protein
MMLMEQLVKLAYLTDTGIQLFLNSEVADPSYSTALANKCFSLIKNEFANKVIGKKG